MGLFSRLLGGGRDSASARKETKPRGEVYAPYGVSWGRFMPEEENQYSYDGPFYEYFEKVFMEEFPDCDIQMEEAPFRHAMLCTFWRGGKKALVVELKSKRSTVERVRQECGQAGIPYLRYYYDVHGWWNTRTYVTNRTRDALGA